MPTWDPLLDTGQPEIDAQHHELFACATRLSEAVSRGRAGEEVAGALRFLVDYVLRHFEAEEALMRRHGYPEAEAHAEIHGRLSRRLGEVVAAFQGHGSTEALVGEVDAMMRGWVSIHIGEKDRAFAEFLRAKGIA
jgi:hemerythrin